MNNPYDANDQKSGQPTASSPRRRSVFLGPSIVGACLVLVGVAQWLAPEVDHQLANIFSAVLLAIAGITLAIWWFRRVPDAVIRWGIPLTALLAVAGFLILYNSLSRGPLFCTERCRLGGKRCVFRSKSSVKPLFSAVSIVSVG